MVKIGVYGKTGFIGGFVKEEMKCRQLIISPADLGLDIIILLARKKDNCASNIQILPKLIYNTKAKLVYVSSSVVHSKIPSLYRAEKRYCEEICNIVRNESGERVIVRPYNVYGPGQPDYFIIPTIINQALKGDTIVIRNKFAERNFIYVKDTAKALVDIALSDNLLADTIELGHERRPIWRIVEIVGRILGKKLTIDAPAANEVERDAVYMPLDSNKWPTDGFISMEEGLKETIEFYKKGCA